jgi:ATP-dependent helicase/nuclease subunit B
MGFRDVVALHERSIEKTGTPPNLAETRNRVQRWMAQHAVDLAGEPLEGLQVMGLLESRGLDFDEVFVLDVNEGTLPDGAPPPSFMPLDLQRSIGLPGRPERDGIFSAYLHRLLHRSRKIHLLCVGADLGDSGTEPSRFLGQLEAWATSSLSGVAVNKSLWSTPLPDPAPPVPALGWSASARESVDTMLTNGISPSALNQALTCERQFHYRYVLGLGETDTVEEHLEASTIGTVIHKAVEEGLQATVGRVLQKEDLKALAREVKPKLVDALSAIKKGAQADTGENVLVLRMAAAMIGRWVRDELREWTEGTEVTIVGLEEKLHRTFILDDGRHIAFKGVADRVEVHRNPRGEVWQVVDYKTGAVEGRELRLKGQWEETLRKGKHGKALQLLLYAAMLRDKHPEAHAIRSAIRAGRKGLGDATSLLTLHWDGATLLNHEHDDALKTWLGEVVSALLPSNDEDTVAHNEDSKWCADCLTLE